MCACVTSKLKLKLCDAPTSSEASTPIVPLGLARVTAKGSETTTLVKVKVPLLVTVTV